ncbi:MAG: PQQ-dependent sugar dehydrogenase, partial [Rhodothermales bacterium]
LDPNFDQNNWLYLYYAPEDGGDSRLSRFTLVDGKLEMESEKILLTVHVQRKRCCHAAGAIAFDPQGNLYLSTGDNSGAGGPDPTILLGSPMDERPGRSFADAQRSSGNTNDLRGKILRIRPLPDGTYAIPEGNLFPGDSLHRPEIYTMGHRNPFRIAIDAETGWLYWGDVGRGDPPNERGGWGWDEFNQARASGNFGWPYFTGPNQPYRDYDYETGALGDFFDPEAPINDSPNNTGARALPPTQRAWIWYTYGMSEQYPELGAGGINPMAGPVVHHDAETYGPTALPPYYEGKHIIYEWMRNWVQVVSLDEEGGVLDISPLLSGMEFIRPMDMEIGPEGALYLIEWGDTFWGSNANAQIVRLDYYGERLRPEAPQAVEEEPSSRVSFDWPVDGGFFGFEEPMAYKVTVETPGTGTSTDGQVVVTPYTGFDTHALPLDAKHGREGTFEITRAYTHVPDLHFMDRYAEVEACYERAGVQPVCTRIKLHPKRKEAEHFSSSHGAVRTIEGLHPASEHYAQTALAAMGVKDGHYLAYAPVNLAHIESLTLRLRPEAPATVEVRLDAPDGPLLAEAAIDGTPGPIVADQAKATAAILVGDPARAQGLDSKIYNGWSDITLPIEDPGGTHTLFLVFRGADSGTLLQLDWIDFNGAGMTR